MAIAFRADFMAQEQTIHKARVQMLGAYMEQIRGLNEHSEWALLVSKAREAGLGKDDLCRELSCAWSTVTRWMSGQTAPGPFAQTGIKDKLLGMIEEMRQKELSYIQSREYA